MAIVMDGSGPLNTGLLGDAGSAVGCGVVSRGSCDTPGGSQAGAAGASTWPPTVRAHPNTSARLMPGAKR